MRHFGFLAALTALTLLAAACAQPGPERRPFDVPTEIVPDWVNPADAEGLFPADGGCLLAVGGGARVLEVLEDTVSGFSSSQSARTAAHGVLRAGDIVMSIDGSPTSSLEMLLRMLEGRPPGDVVEVEGTRLGVPFSTSVELSPVPGEPERAILGIIAETKLDPVPPSQLTASGVADPFSRLVTLDGWTYLHEPLAAAWSPYPGVPATRMAALGSELYAVAADGPLSLVRVATGELIPIDPGPVVFEGTRGPIEVVATGFETALTSVGNLVLVAGTVSLGANTTTFALHAVDPVARLVVWSRPLGLSPSGNPLAAVDGYRSPSGSRALVTLVEHDLASNARYGALGYYLVDEQGEEEASLPGIKEFLTTSRVTGWYDEDSLLYVADFDTPQIVRWSLDTGDHSVIRPVAAEDAFDLVTVMPVGDGQHLVQIRATEVSLINVNQPESVRPISRGCRYEPIGESANPQMVSVPSAGDTS